MKDKTVILGVTGGIAAYKAVDLLRMMKRAGANVKVVMTEAAARFVGEITFRVLSGNPVGMGLFDSPEGWDVNHVALAQEADLIIVAPATANVIGKAANGLADDLLSCVIMASRRSVLFAPAMNSGMYESDAVQANIETLKSRGFHFIGPGTGDLACGQGVGRMEEPGIIFEAAAGLLSCKTLDGVPVVITAGPTREKIDAVRFISNPSTGRMGYAAAREAARRGACVTLISGPSDLSDPFGVKIIRVQSALDMQKALDENLPGSKIFISAAAVSDFRPSEPEDYKIKKSDASLNVELVPNPDLLALAGKNKGGRIHVGFAAETEDMKENALKKLGEKNLDMIVANDIRSEDSGFGTETDRAMIILSDGTAEDLPVMKKEELAGIILDRVEKLLK
ncbi:MAG: bifunctional phosphopantothenoylcysteine decarboxylase/phosphopantothenate--cysteine ligase CoaBC [Chloroflexi bacterium]|nr:bifunctional phosphopantothenoylcysteine decarboxylase/phosphopantothenate--cysteine ligase CoaBC [Chloroflexota bacterium]